MSRCPSCGGVINRDCFNPIECAQITENQRQYDHQQHWEQLTASQDAALKERDALIESLSASYEDKMLLISKQDAKIKELEITVEQLKTYRDDNLIHTERLEVDCESLRSELAEQKTKSERLAKLSFSAGRDYQNGEYSEYHGGHENSRPDFSEWLEKKQNESANHQSPGNPG